MLAPDVDDGVWDKIRSRYADLGRAQRRERYEGSLFEFVKAAWPSIDSSEFKSNWAIEAFCEHLEAVTRGEIPRLLANYPPRASKTTIASICWPAWIWAQSEITFLSGPQVRFLCASYNQLLSMQIANKCRRLILSPWYQQLWGDRFSLMTDQNTKGQFDNSKGGSRASTSVGGSLLGLGGDVICFPYDEIVHTERGPLQIGEIVNGRLQVRVWSYNTETGRTSLQPITGWHRNHGSGLVRVMLSDGAEVVCTPDHKIWTMSGWKSAVALTSGDVLPCPKFPNSMNARLIDPKRLSERPRTQRGLANSSDVVRGKLCEVAIFARTSIRFLAQTISGLTPSLASSNLLNSAGGNAVPQAYGLGRIGTSGNCSGDVPSQFCPRSTFENGKGSVTFGVINILSAGSILKIIKTRVHAIAVSVSDLLPGWIWTDERDHNELMAEKILSAPVNPQTYSWVSLIRGGFQNFLGLAKRMAALMHYSRLTTNAAHVGYAVSRITGDRKPIFVGYVGHVKETFCVDVDKNHTLLMGAGHVICHNCVDDPHNTETEKVVETDAERRAVASWWQEVHSTRLNDPKNSAIVVVMQRLHEEDLSGVILSSDEDWVNLCIPMEMDLSRSYATVVLPSTDPDVWDDPRTKEGELMWPERFGPAEVKLLKSALGPYMASGRLQQMPVPKGGGIIKREWWQLWDEAEAARYGIEWNGDRKDFPEMAMIVGSIDTNYGQKEENDFSAMTVWGVWEDLNRNKKAMLMYAWNVRKPLHGKVISAEPREGKVAFQARQREAWGLVELIADTCRRYKVVRLLIEDKTKGRDVAEEINRLYAREQWGVELVNPVGDKTSRGHSVVPMFTDDMVWAPNTHWSELVINQCSMVPKSAHDDLFDTVSMFLHAARERGWLIRADEMSAALEDESRFQPQLQSVAQQYGV